MWFSDDVFHYMFKDEFVTLESLKVPSGGGPNFLLGTNWKVSLRIVSHLSRVLLLLLVRTVRVQPFLPDQTCTPSRPVHI